MIKNPMKHRAINIRHANRQGYGHSDYGNGHSPRQQRRDGGRDNNDYANPEAREVQLG